MRYENEASGSSGVLMKADVSAETESGRWRGVALRGWRKRRFMPHLKTAHMEECLRAARAKMKLGSRAWP